jgi:hypothetical protein
MKRRGRSQDCPEATDPHVPVSLDRQTYHFIDSKLDLLDFHERLGLSDLICWSSYDPVYDEQVSDTTKGTLPTQ